MNLKLHYAKAVLDRLVESRGVTIVPKESLLTQQFGVDFKALPPDVKDAVHERYHRWRQNPQSLKFEHKFGNKFAVEVTRKIHAVCEINDGVVIWHMIKSYDDYANFLTSRRGKKFNKKP